MKKVFYLNSIIIAIMLLAGVNLKAQDCNNLVTPYKIGFENDEVTEYNLWTKDTIDGAYWRIRSGYDYAHTGDNVLYLKKYNNAWAFTRCFQMSSSKEYTLTFWHKVYNGSAAFKDQNLMITLSYSDTVTSVVDTIADYKQVYNSFYSKKKIKFTVPGDGTYHIGWYVYGLTGTDNSGFYIDDIEISEYNCDSIKPDLGNDTLICNASSLKLDPGADFVKYQWNTGNPADTLQTLTVGVTGTYSVSVTDVFGCNAVSTSRVVTVFEFPKDTMLTDHNTTVTGLNYNTTICNKDSVKLKILMDNALPGSDYKVLWYWKDDYYTTAFGTGDSVYAKEEGQYYYIMNYLPKGCSQNSTMNFNLNISYPFSGEKLDSVTVDIASGKNLLKWKKNQYDSSTVYFKIYKESSVSGVYEKIDSVASTDSAYTDLTSDPAVRAERYDIAVIDTCGNESELSGYPHKTVHLTINLGINNTYNLIWSDYSGLDYTSYIIYRDTASNMGHKELIAEVQKGINSYTDTNPVINKTNYYFVSIASPVKKLKPLVKSNVVTTKGVGVAELTIDAADLKIYPNPASKMLNVEFLMLNEGKVDIRLLDITDREVAVILNEERAIGKNNVAFNIGNIDKGIYFVKVAIGENLMIKKIIKN